MGDAEVQALRFDDNPTSILWPTSTAGGKASARMTSATSALSLDRALVRRTGAGGMPARIDATIWWR
jgi:hypothetical protein